MRKYKDYCPTQFDSHIELKDREDWLVLDLGQTRDSNCLSYSNFEAAQKILGDKIPGNKEYCEHVEVHRFGHWGPGWFEIILIHPSLEAIGQEIEDRLEDYPVLDEEDFSAREHEEECESWDSWGRNDLIKLLQKEFCLSESTVNWLENTDTNDRIHSLYLMFSKVGTQHTSEGPSFDTRWITNPHSLLTREALAHWIKAQRKTEKTA